MKSRIFLALRRISLKLFWNSSLLGRLSDQAMGVCTAVISSWLKSTTISSHIKLRASGLSKICFHCLQTCRRIRHLNEEKFIKILSLVIACLEVLVVQPPLDAAKHRSMVVHGYQGLADDWDCKSAGKEDAYLSQKGVSSESWMRFTWIVQCTERKTLELNFSLSQRVRGKCS